MIILQAQSWNEYQHHIKKKKKDRNEWLQVIEILILITEENVRLC
jgi:hypothetical protein